MWSSLLTKRNVVVLVFAGICFQTSLAHSDGQRIALLLKAPNNTFYDAITLGVRERAAKYEMAVDIQYGKDEEDWQSQVEFLRKHVSDYDAFIVVPNRSDRFVEVAAELKQKHKPIVIVDTPLTRGEEHVASTISSDNLLGGRLAGLFVANKIKEKRNAGQCGIGCSINP